MSTINQSLILRQRDSFLQIIEELRFSRKTNKTLEEKVESLQLECLKLENAVEDLSSKLQTSESRCVEMDKKVTAIENMKLDGQLEEENRKLKIALEASEATIAGLKKNIVSYKTSTHALEKKFGECEQKLSVAQQSSSLFSSKLEQFRATVDKINKQSEQTRESHLRLEQNLAIASSVNQEFVCNQEHLKLIITDLKKEREDLKCQVVSLERKLQLQEAKIVNGNQEKLFQLENQIKCLQETNSSVLQHCSFLEEELKECKKTELNAHLSAKNAHHLLNTCQMQRQLIVDELQKKIETYETGSNALQKKASHENKWTQAPSQSEESVNKSIKYSDILIESASSKNVGEGCKEEKMDP